MKRILTLTGLLMLYLWLWPANASAQRIYLVSVGVADYPGEQLDIPGPDMDARVMFTLYQSNTAASCLLFVDDKAKHGTVKRKTRELFSRAGEDDIAVFFFSGHGYQGGFLLYDTTLSYYELRRIFSSCKARNKMIFADACFAGAMREDKTSPRTGKDDRQSSVMLFLSSRDDESSLTSGAVRNSYFTTCLARCLKGGADYNHDRIITARELYMGVREGVIELSHDYQHPVMWGKFPNDMPVMVWF